METQAGTVSSEQESDLFKLNPFLRSSEEPEETEELTMYLWKCNLQIFEIFTLVCLYLTKEGGIDSHLLIKLIEERKLKTSKALLDINYLWAGYNGR